MYIQTMNNNELLKEYHADLPELKEFDHKINDSPSVSSYLMKHSKNEKCTFIRNYTTKRHNKYVTVFVYKREKQSKIGYDWSWEAYSIALMNTSKGISAITFYDDQSFALIIQAHYFMRYKERYMQVCDWKTRTLLMQAKTQEEIIALYVSRNPSALMMDTKVQYDDLKHIFCPVSDGVALLQWDGKTLQANTFITEGMYSQKQKELVDISNTYKDFDKTIKTLQEELSQIIQNY